MLLKVYGLEVCDGVYNEVSRGANLNWLGVAVVVLLALLDEQRVVQLSDFQALVGHPQ